jgi:hypothetical protein
VQVGKRAFWQVEISEGERNSGAAGPKTELTSFCLGLQEMQSLVA